MACLLHDPKVGSHKRGLFIFYQSDDTLMDLAVAPSLSVM